jgi:hypothetical protein
MPRKSKRRRKLVEEHTHLALRIDKYEARVETSVNYHAHEPQYAWRDTEDEPLYHFLGRLVILGTSTYPEKRAGETYELTIYGDDSPDSRINWKLTDVQLVDEHRVPKYREYRGKQLPVYAPPKGIATLDKVHGEPRRHAAIFVSQRFVTDLLILLGHNRQLFMAIHERKIEGQRWIQSVSLQTTDGAEE